MYMAVHFFLVKISITGNIEFMTNYWTSSVNRRIKKNLHKTKASTTKPLPCHIWHNFTSWYCSRLITRSLLLTFTPADASKTDIYVSRIGFPLFLFHFQLKYTMVTAIIKRHNMIWIITISAYHMMFWSILSPHI